MEALKAKLDIPPTIRDVLGAGREHEFMSQLDAVAEAAFDDQVGDVGGCATAAHELACQRQHMMAPSQCTGANPRYPLIKDLRAMLRAAWESPILPLTSLETDVHE